MSELTDALRDELRDAFSEHQRNTQPQFDYFEDDQWRSVAAEPKKAIEAGLRLLYRLVLAVEVLSDDRE